MSLKTHLHSLKSSQKRRWGAGGGCKQQSGGVLPLHGHIHVLSSLLSAPLLGNTDEHLGLYSTCIIFVFVFHSKVINRSFCLRRCII